MKTTYLLLLNLILALTFRTAQAGDNGSTVREGRLSLDEVTNVVLANNPAIKAAQEKWRAMKARVPQAAAWEDLSAQARSRAARYVSIPPNSFTDQSFMLQQEVPISGKNLSRARAATAEAGAAFEDFRRTKLDVLSRARAAFHRLANEYAQLEVNQRNVELLNQFAEVNRQRYEVGNASQADVLTGQTDAAKLLEAQSDIFRRISDAQSQLNVLMNRPAQSPLAQPSQIPFQRPHFSLQALQAVALSARPEMQRAQNRVEAERFRVELANRQWFSDPTLDVQAQRYNQAGQAVHELEATRTETLGLVRDQLKKIETAAHHYELYSDKILPLARQAVQSNRVAYETSSANFLELITAQRVLQDVESAHVNHLADYQVAVAELDAIVGIEDWLPQKNSAERRKSK